MLHKIKFQKNIYNVSLQKRTKKNKKKNKNKRTKTKTRSRPLIAVLEEVVKISFIIFESHQQNIALADPTFQ